MVTYWATNKIRIAAPHLHKLLLAIQTLLQGFVATSFAHVYKELNTKTYELSKKAFVVIPGVIKI